MPETNPSQSRIKEALASPSEECGSTPSGYLDDEETLDVQRKEEDVRSDSNESTYSLSEPKMDEESGEADDFSNIPFNQYWKVSDDPLPSDPSTLREKAPARYDPGSESREQNQVDKLTAFLMSQDHSKGQARAEDFLQFNLCSECGSLDLTAEHFLPRGPHPNVIAREGYHKLRERPFADFQKKAGCPLCSLICHAVEQSCLKNSVKSSGLHCVISMVKFSCFWDNMKDCESFRYLAVECGNSEVGDPKEFEPLFTVDLVPVQSEQYPLAFIGRALDPVRISPELVQSWLRQCEHSHGLHCSAIARHPGEKPVEDRMSAPEGKARYGELFQHLYFIDVHLGCLTRLASGGRFIALSYVWGTCKSLCAVRSNLATLMEPGSLLRAKEDLSAVVRDAIALTSDIGERYLWIDSLCIIQDDDESKQRTIDKMNLIYENAIMTIIAASGADASAGLPDWKPNSRTATQKSALIAPGLKLISPTSLKGLKDTVWGSRAWTFQEWMFSRRKLIFVHGQVFFKCCRDFPCLEDILSEGQIYGMEDYTYKLPSDDVVEGSRMMPMMRKMWRYFFPSILSDYTARKLTYQSDALNAFAGISEMLNNQCDVNISFGMPTSCLSLDLVWMPPTYLRRRAGFPSWSWAGWVGEISANFQPLILNTEAEAKWIAQNSWINWYIYDSNNKYFRLLPQAKVEAKPSSDEEDRIAASNLHDTLNPSTTQSTTSPHFHFLRQKYWSQTSEYASEAVPAIKVLDDDKFPYGAPSLPDHTIFFRSLKERFRISKTSPRGSSQDPMNLVHLYTLRGTYAGVALLCEPSLAALLEFATDGNLRYPVTVDAVLISGPNKSMAWIREFFAWPESASDEAARESARFYQVMLVSRWAMQDYKDKEFAKTIVARWRDLMLKAAGYPSKPDLEKGVYERAGPGAILESVVEELDFGWKDILLQ